jgi:hypothetical protein
LFDLLVLESSVLLVLADIPFRVLTRVVRTVAYPLFFLEFGDFFLFFFFFGDDLFFLGTFDFLPMSVAFLA